jgi:hypothetical protein
MRIRVETRIVSQSTSAENCIGNGPPETSVNIAAKTPAAPAPPNATDQLPDKYDALDIIHIHTKM